LEISEEDRDVLTHYGIRKRSGRYPYGSGKEDAQKYPWEAGETPAERANAFQSIIKDMRRQGLKDKAIAETFGMTQSQLRTTVSVAKEEKKAADVSQARRLKDKGLSNVAIGERMGVPESTVRNLLREDAETKASILASTAAMLKDQVEKKKYIDVGKGVELHLNVSHEKLRDARRLLESEGYKLHYIKVEQLGTGKHTTMKILTKSDVSTREVYQNMDQIQQIRVRSDDGGRRYDAIRPPLSVDPKRIKVRYAEEGGTDADGVIYVRRGVKDVSLGKSSYAQVRIAVGDGHYLKGMAMYNDDMPDGVDLVFNTNKKNTGNKLDAMKEMKRDKSTGEVDKDDPFGSLIDDQIYKKNPDGSFVRDANGRKIVESAMNLVNKEGTWDTWSKTLSSQMLSKQKPSLAQEQLTLARESKEREFREIMSLSNPTVKKHLLEKFADSVDSASVHLKAAHLPRQATKVILPVNTMAKNEVYAPTFRDGETVVLVRFPHGHISEIPELRVNNRHRQAKDLLGNAPDAIGIHHSVAERLSGADFDGDTVLVIPNNQGKVRNDKPLEGLKGFDPQSAYPPYDGMRTMDGGTYNASTRKTEFREGQKANPKAKGMEMGKISNLITDMTVQGAPDEEIVRAVRHSMVVIDAEKHRLNYKLSEKENNISALRTKYQPRPPGKPDGGASTLISRATAETRVLDRKPRPSKEGGPIDSVTGKKVYVETGAEFYTGKKKTEKTTQLAETDDAYTLISEKNTRIERVYADHSNSLKALANQARREFLGIKDFEYSPSANREFAAEVKMLNAKLGEALMNAPRERQAQVLANVVYNRKIKANPDMDDAEIKKVKSKALANARDQVGAGKDKIDITPTEWQAIQAGAISKTMLEKILDNTDVEKIKELATPRDKPVMDATMKNRAMLLLRGDRYSLADVADQLGISVSTLRAGLSGVGA
jgi:DNA-binding CsgD family transcriptional regulator